jgi:hypothetical protein
MKKITLVVLALCSWGSSVMAQVGLVPGANDPSKADLRVLTQNNCLVSSTIDASKGQAEIYIAGIDQGYVDVEDLKAFMLQLTQSDSVKNKAILEMKEEDAATSTKGKDKTTPTKEFNPQARLPEQI